MFELRELDGVQLRGGGVGIGVAWMRRRWFYAFEFEVWAKRIERV